MKKLKSYEIRQMWLDFFKQHGHEVIPSASLIPVDDPSLLWINAGVAPLKKYFDGRLVPSNKRMCNAQKSIRTNDIENVGKTARHHTFFEMLGNFSIGDYFREEVLTWAYELLFCEKWYGFDKNLIYITYYPSDQDTFNKWISLGVEKDHLIPLKENFWEIGEGPCGPDTEIFFDRGIKYDPENVGIKLLEEDIENDRYIEIWNIVFSQFNSESGVDRKNYKELPSKNIDTGSGLERLACVFQETETNYETDLFMPYIKAIEEMTNVCYFSADKNQKMAFRVIADHIRSVTFAIADGAVLGNEGRGYVLRRMLRRAERMGRKLGLKEAFLYKLVDYVVKNMANFYSYLDSKKDLIIKLVKNEEDAFLKTLESGEKKLSEILKQSVNFLVSGKDAFLLYDTFGFPLELTIEAANDQGFKVDETGFAEELKQQKIRARKARAHSETMNKQNVEFLNFVDESSFLGYECLSSISKVIAIFKDGIGVTEASGKIAVVFDKTPFYALSGGQIGDKGKLIIDDFEIDVLETDKLPNSQAIHIINMKDKVLKIQTSVKLIVDVDYRKNISKNHSATHLLNEALRQVLGSHVKQLGSMVSVDYLRFDFNHYQNLSTEELLKVEKQVNSWILEAHPVKVIEMTLEEAKKTGAQAVFGEKYGNIVRLVDMNVSKELCGGTHVSNTSEIEKFGILSIESKGSGVYRIEAVTGTDIANDFLKKNQEILSEIEELNKKTGEIVNAAKDEAINLDIHVSKIPNILGQYQDNLNLQQTLTNTRIQYNKISKEYSSRIREIHSNDIDKYLDSVKQFANFNYLLYTVSDIDTPILKDIIDKISDRFDNIFILFANVNADKIVFIAKSKNVSLSAGNVVREIAKLTEGSGGGRQDFAMAGGKNIQKLPEAMVSIEEKYFK